MKYSIVYKRSASDELLQLPATMARKILAGINSLADDPRPHNCIKLKGSMNEYRIRYGNYRLVYSVSDSVVTVFVIKISHRKNVYR